MTFYIDSAVSMSLSCREKNAFGHLYPFVMKVICISLFVQARTLTHDEIEGTSHFLIKYAFKCISACSIFLNFIYLTVSLCKCFCVHARTPSRAA